MPALLKATRSGGGGGAVNLKSSLDGDLRIAQYLPPYAMLCASGQLFGVDMTAGTATAPKAAAITTTVEWTVYNANQTKHLILVQAGIALQSGTAGLGLSIIAASAIGAQTAVNSSYAGTVISCLDGSLKIPNFYLDNVTTIIGGTPSWQTLAAIDQLASDGVGNGIVAKAQDIGGLIIAPPGGSLCLDIIGETGSTALFDVSLVVAEVELDS